MKILKNKGLIDLDVIKLMGVNVKDSESSIGMFGTGLKYAIAVFLREGIPLVLYRGVDKFEFHTEKKEIRGKSFDVCSMIGPMDEVELGFTTELGKNWDLWQAYREIHSNCLDEGGCIYDSDKEHKEQEFTTFCIDLSINPDDIFINTVSKKCLFADASIEIYEGSSDCIFYKGIRAKELKDESIYTYNIKKECTLTEDRLLCYDHEVSEFIAEKVASLSSEKEVIKNVVTAESGTYEKTISPCSYSWVSPSKEFVEVVKSETGSNSGFVEHMRRNEPKKPLTPEERKSEFCLALKELCDSYSVTCSDSETEPTTFSLYGGILMAREGE